MQVLELQRRQLINHSFVTASCERTSGFSREFVLRIVAQGTPAAAGPGVASLPASPRPSRRGEAQNAARLSGWETSAPRRSSACFCSRCCSSARSGCRRSAARSARACVSSRTRSAASRSTTIRRRSSAGPGTQDTTAACAGPRERNRPLGAATCCCRAA